MHSTFCIPSRVCWTIVEICESIQDTMDDIYGFGFRMCCSVTRDPRSERLGLRKDDRTSKLVIISITKQWKRFPLLFTLNLKYFHTTKKGIHLGISSTLAMFRHSTLTAFSQHLHSIMLRHWWTKWVPILVINYFLHGGCLSIYSSTYLFTLCHGSAARGAVNVITQ